MKQKVIILGLIFISGFSILKASPWQSVRNNQKGTATLKYQGELEINEWHYAYKNRRRYKSGMAVWASPAAVVIGGHPVVFIGGYDQTLHALDIITKRSLWKKITNGPITSTPAIGKIDGLEVVFFGSSDRTLYANVAFNGRKVWTKELIPPANTLGDVHISSPFLHKERIYITVFAHDKSLKQNQQRGILFSINKFNGEIVWQKDIVSGDLSDPIGFEYMGKIYLSVAARRGLLQCFEIKNDSMEKVWQFQMPHEVLGSPVISLNGVKPLLFLGSKYGNFIAINALTGKEVWQQMAGNWIDNSAALGEVNGKELVFVGSHDYFLYAYKSATGELVWKRPLGGEVYSAPAFFNLQGRSVVSVAALDNHVYLIGADNGEVITSFFIGNPIWDKIAKGEILWASPIAVEAGTESCLVHGSYNDKVYVLPLVKECTLTARAKSVASLWWSLLVVLVIFLGILVPILIKFPFKEK